MSLILGLPHLTNKKVDAAKNYVQEIIDSSTSPLTKELGILVIKALDYDPIDIRLSDLNYFRKHYADDLQRIINDSLKAETPDEESLFWLAFYLHALQFESLSLKNGFNPGELELGAFLETNFHLFPTDIQQRIRYISYKLGADIANQRISLHSKKEMGELQDHFNEMKSAIEKIGGWEEKLSGWEGKVNDQELRLKNQLEKLNFVGLSKAFSKLSDEKNIERIIHASISIFVGLVFLAAPIIMIYLYSNHPDSLVALNNIHVLVLIAAFEFSLLYFFRVALQNYSSAKAQLLQLRLRLELCAFVEGYVEFVEPIRSKSGEETLSKFESIIFSGISLDPQKVPSQFDGIESILNLIKTIKTDSK